jgi:predicted transposase/invertase (TIGR01784 family)
MTKGLAKGREEGREEGRKEGRAEGREEGRKEGRAEEKLTVARQMKELGLSQEMIAQVTGLTTEEINKL